ncbi:MAG: SDR family NAD(P)-dependent oxidoreductase [Bacteroidota bacterium]
MNILVTGASGHLGQAVAQRFLAEGHHVYGTMQPDSHQAELEAHARFERVEIDLLEEGSLAAFLLTVPDSIGVGIFTVGGFAMGDLDGTSLESLEKMIRLNLYTAFLSTKALFHHMREHEVKGRLVLVSSRPGLDPRQGAAMLPYALSKAAIPPLADILNAEGEKHEIITTVVAPSTIDTPINREAMPQADFSKWVSPAEIAEVIYFTTLGQGRILREPILKLYGNA